jgi:hypothetical protein
MAREVLDMKPITLSESPSAHQHPPQLVIDLTDWTEGESDSFALNETKIANTSTIEPTTNDPYTMHVNEMNQQLLDFLMNQLRPYGIMDPDSITSTTTIPPSTSTFLPNAAEVLMKNLISNGTDTDEIINAQQMQLFRDYVMQQLMPLEIVGSSEKPVTSSTTVTPSTTTTASVTKSNLMNFNLPQNLDVKTLLSIFHALEKNKENSNVISA